MKRRQQTRRDTFGNPWVAAVVLIRLTGIAIVPAYPALGMAASMVFDWLDSVVLVQKARFSHDRYHLVDKVIDQVWSFVMLAVSFATPYFSTLFILYVYRLIGFMLHLLTKKVVVYLFFPNVFEFVFLWYAVIVPFTGTDNGVPAWQVVLASLLVKEMQEYALHIWWPRRLAVYRKHGWPPFQRALGWSRVD